MDFVERDIPLWTVTTWDKKYNAVDNSWQPKTIKYKYLLSDELDSIRDDAGSVRLLYTGKEIGYTTEELAGDALSEGEIVSIPWGGTPSVKYYKGKFVTGDNRIATSNDANALLNKYIYYFLLGNLAELSSYYRGAGLKHPSMKAVLSMKISYPCVVDQAKIISILDKLQSIIAHRKQQLAKLDELVKARFVEMFGDPVSNPMGWEVVSIKEIVTDVRYGTSKPAVIGGKYPYLRMNNLTIDGHLDLSDLKYIDIPDEEIEKCVVRKGDVLFNRTNSIELVGKTAVFDLEEEMVIAGYIIRVRLNERLLPEILSLYMNLEPIKMLLRNMAKGAVNQANINAQELQSIKVYVPNIELQKQFIEIKSKIDKSKVAVQKALDEAQLLFDSLMQEYFG